MCLTCSTQIFENFDGFFVIQNQSNRGTVFKFQRSKPFQLPAKIVIGSSLKPKKVVKNVWKKMSNKTIVENLVK